jgi:hypothetical protein
MSAELNIPDDAHTAARLVLPAVVLDWQLSNALESAAPLIVAAELERVAGLVDAESEYGDGGRPDGLCWAADTLRRRAAELRGEQP